MKIVVNEKLNIYRFERKTCLLLQLIFHQLHIWLYKLLIESLFINSLIFQVIAVILAACYYLLNKQENVDNQTK